MDFLAKVLGIKLERYHAYLNRFLGLVCKPFLMPKTTNHPVLINEQG